MSVKRRSVEKREHITNPKERNWTLRSKYQETAKQSRKTCKNAFNTYMQLSVLPDLKNNPKKFFSFIKNK